MGTRCSYATVRYRPFGQSAIRSWNSSIPDLHIDSSEVLTAVGSALLLIRTGTLRSGDVDPVGVPGFRLDGVNPTRTPEIDRHRFVSSPSRSRSGCRCIAVAGRFIRSHSITGAGLFSAAPARRAHEKSHRDVQLNRGRSVSGRFERYCSMSYSQQPNGGAESRMPYRSSLTIRVLIKGIHRIGLVVNDHSTSQTRSWSRYS